jgi:hypothetical protein
MAIFDPDGICPINLQRSSVSFERMGMDRSMATAILHEHVEQLIEFPRSWNSLLKFMELCHEVHKSPGVYYEGLGAPICATARGVFLATPMFFRELKINILYLIDSIHAHDAPSLTELLKPGEAVLCRNSQGGIQSDLAWFRGIVADDNWGNWYKRAAGVPNLSKVAMVFAMNPKKWSPKSGQGRVARAILDPLEHASLDERHPLVTTGGPGEVKILISRIKALIDLLDEGAQIAAWKLAASQPDSEDRSILCDVWRKSCGGPLIA